jgi:pyruvate dehydrogenase E1 component alpha subunit
VRGGGGPAFLECRSHRFASHSSATRDTRSRAELETAKALCPIDRLSTQLVADNAASPERLAELAHEVAAAVDAAFAAADAAPWPDPAEAFADV